ncbi:MAG TPA: stage II sporulation protein M [Dermatophilaceae bacterium]|nr:stage II sporulation protein M [Dermatophilaceae bacterium]
MTVYGIGRNDHRPGFREWVSQQRVVLLLLGAVLLGFWLGSLFRWDLQDPEMVVSGWSIFAHNASLALVLCVATPYVAGPAVAFNSFVLGLALHGSVVAAGLRTTFELTWAHVPLELLAWVLTYRCAVRLVEALRAVHSTGSDRRAVLPVVRLLALTLVVYAAAAMAEWAEMNSVLGRG